MRYLFLVVCVAVLTGFLLLPEKYLIPEGDILIESIPTVTPTVAKKPVKKKTVPTQVLDEELNKNNADTENTVFEEPLEVAIITKPPNSIPTSQPTPALTPVPKPTPIPTPTPTPKKNPLDADQLLVEINKWRADLGLNAFTESEGSCWIADKRIPMVVANFSHDGFEETIQDYVDLTGILFWNGGENIAKGARNDAEVVALWENSPGHNALMSYDAPHACAAVEGDVAVLIVEFSIIN